MSAQPGEPVRVLYLLPDLAVGGGQVILRQTIGSLDGPGWRHLVVAFGDGPLLNGYRGDGIDCRILGTGSPTGWPGALLELIRLIRRERIDVIVSLNTPVDRTMAQLAAAVTGRPVVVWFMSMAVPLIAFPPPPDRALAFLKRLTLHPFNHVSVRRLRLRVATSAAVAGSFADHLGLSPDDFVVAPPGLPDDAFDGPPAPAAATRLRAELGVDDAYPVLLNVGMLIPLKGQQRLVEMMELLRDTLPRAHLLLVGEGPDGEALARQVAASPVGDRIHLLGRRGDVGDLLRVSDGLLSASRTEGFGMSVLEAMAAAVPVVGVRTPAFLEFVEEGGSAVLVDRQEAAPLAAAVADVFADPERARAMGDRGRAIADDFRIGDRGRAFGSLLRAVVAPDPGRPTTTRRRLGAAVRRLGAAAGRIPSRPSTGGHLVVGSGPGQGLRLGRRHTSADYADPPERPVQEVLSSELAPGDVFYDVGANVGFFSLLAARLVGDDGRVVAFEPVPANADAAEANAADNGLTTIEVHRVAAGSGPARRQLYLTRHPGGASLTVEAVGTDLRGATRVEVVAIDDLVEAGTVPPPDLVKIDVEGAELDVLTGLAATLDRHRPTVVIEVDAADPVTADARADEIGRWLAERGHRVERLADGYPGVDWTVHHLVARPVSGG
jgi:FkbM family methyltransferase